MKFEHSFTVQAPIEQGYRGQVEVVQRDDAAHAGHDARPRAGGPRSGNGERDRAGEAAGGRRRSDRGADRPDLQLSGRAASMGRG